jgi:hypothetical protein
MSSEVVLKIEKITGVTRIPAMFSLKMDNTY